ncbi:MAG TPA: leishmanolysin-related zinc metalloendopeptidase [Anaeromyxobacter sp.]|nr:leishmanolysin-related zinc metalloendopeptidase [Anaeromyxobacter sp.]
MTRTVARSAAALAALVALSCGPKSTPPDATYTLEVRYRPSVEGLPDQQRAALTTAVDAAAEQIRAMITAGLVPTRVARYDCEGSLETVRIDERVHGLVVLVSYGALPYPAEPATLASSGPCIVRTRSRYPLVSVVQFNSTSSYVTNALSTGDVAFLQTVALHELFHALGFGTIWVDYRGLVTGEATNDPVFRGSRAVAAAKDFDHAPSTLVGIPVENGGSQGTIGAHWRESELDDELMTGFVEPGAPNPLSHASIASLGDLGYEVDLRQADVDPAFVWPGAALRALSPSTGISFGDDLIQTTPVEVDELAVP